MLLLVKIQKKHPGDLPPLHPHRLYAFYQFVYNLQICWNINAYFALPKEYRYITHAGFIAAGVV